MPGTLGVLRLLSRRYEKTHALYCPFKPKNLKTYCCNMSVWMVWGGWGDAEKSYASMCVEFLLFGREKSQGNHQNYFRVFNTCNSSPILLFCPRNPKYFFLENPKRRAPENDRDLSFQKLIWSHMMPFGVKSDPSC